MQTILIVVVGRKREGRGGVVVALFLNEGRRRIVHTDYVGTRTLLRDVVIQLWLRLNLDFHVVVVVVVVCLLLLLLDH